MKSLSTSLIFGLTLLGAKVRAAPTEGITDQIQTYCHLNLYYCGWNLINTDGAYKERISRALCSRGICDPNDPEIWNSLWNCGSDIEFISICGGAYSCQDGGSGKSDYCK